MGGNMKRTYTKILLTGFMAVMFLIPSGRAYGDKNNTNYLNGKPLADLAGQIAENRNSQAELIQGQFSLVRLGKSLERENHQNNRSDPNPPIVGNHGADSDQELRRRGQFLTHIHKHVLEPRYDKSQ